MVAVDIRDYRDADGFLVQPYFAAFMIEKGYECAREPFERDGHNCEYMDWNRWAWKTFELENGYPVDHHTRNRRSEEFKNWLQNRVNDILKRGLN